MQMGNIPADVLATMLDNVISREWKLSQFTSECRLWKARLRIQTVLLEHPTISAKAEDWDEAKDTFPNTCSARLVDLFAAEVADLKLKSPLAMRFWDMVKKCLKVDVAAIDGQKEIAKVSWSV